PRQPVGVSAKPSPLSRSTCPGEPPLVPKGFLSFRNPPQSEEHVAGVSPPSTSSAARNRAPTLSATLTTTEAGKDHFTQRVSTHSIQDQGAGLLARLPSAQRQRGDRGAGVPAAGQHHPGGGLLPLPDTLLDLPSGGQRLTPPPGVLAGGRGGVEDHRDLHHTTPDPQPLLDGRPVAQDPLPLPSGADVQDKGAAVPLAPALPLRVPHLRGRPRRPRATPGEEGGEGRLPAVLGGVPQPRVLGPGVRGGGPVGSGEGVEALRQQLTDDLHRQQLLRQHQLRVPGEGPQRVRGERLQLLREALPARNGSPDRADQGQLRPHHHHLPGPGVRAGPLSRALLLRSRPQAEEQEGDPAGSHALQRDPGSGAGHPARPAPARQLHPPDQRLYTISTICRRTMSCTPFPSSCAGRSNSPSSWAAAPSGRCSRGWPAATCSHSTARGWPSRWVLRILCPQ
ncbi:hypothetical protein CEXT_490291, partial [Caerostris extrusa]